MKTSIFMLTLIHGKSTFSESFEPVVENSLNRMKAFMTFVTVTLCACLTGYYGFLLFYFGRGFRRMAPGSGKETPSVTVVCSARNEEKNLPGLLRCLSIQTYPKEKLEFILVDDRSDDATPALLEEFAREHPNAKVLRIPKDEKNASPKKNAIAKALANASGDIILTTDADCLPGPEWIAGIIRCYDAETGMVLGYAPYRTDGPYDAFFHKLLALEYFTMGALAAATASMGHPSTCNGANLSFRKKVFNEVGGYGDGKKWLSGDDDLFMQRIHSKTDWKIRFAASTGAAVPNNPPRNLREFIRQRIRFSSKHLAYPPRMIAVLSGVYLFYVSLLTLTLASFFVKTLPVFCGALWLVKIVAEMSFLTASKKRMEKRPLLKYYFVLIPFHLLYIVFIPILGQIVRPQWK
jgi:cellulose synthase/poly-beta-1,6-N-acetylglucosamine synthase-like glycosyltransferase